MTGRCGGPLPCVAGRAGNRCDLWQAAGSGGVRAAATRGRRAGQSGSVTVEVVVLAPVVVVFILFVVALGRYETVRGQVVGAARVAAEQASQAPTPVAAVAAASAAAPPMVAGDGPACRNLRVTTQTAAFAPGGTVAVDVRCTVSMADLLVPGLPGSIAVDGHVVAQIDQYRAAG